MNRGWDTFSIYYKKGKVSRSRRKRLLYWAIRMISSYKVISSKVLIGEVVFFINGDPEFVRDSDNFNVKKLESIQKCIRQPNINRIHNKFFFCCCCNWQVWHKNLPTIWPLRGGQNICMQTRREKESSDIHSFFLLCLLTIFCQPSFRPLLSLHEIFFVIGKIWMAMKERAAQSGIWEGERGISEFQCRAREKRKGKESPSLLFHTTKLRLSFLIQFIFISSLRKQSPFTYPD